MSRRQKMAALLISPDDRIASQIRSSADAAGTFDIVGELRNYPAPETIETRLRQVRAEVLLLDVATSLETASEIIRRAGLMHPPAPVIALHAANDAAAVLRSLRCGAHEFFHLPFEASVQEAAIDRLTRQLGGTKGERERARLVVFTAAKPGAGVSTLALQTACALKNASPSRRVLLADLNLSGGSVAFSVNATHGQSVVDLLRPGVNLTHQVWSGVVIDKWGVDLLPAPEFPEPEADPAGLPAVLEWARGTYDWIVADLPIVMHRVTLMSLAAADHAFLVCTPQLGSLHLTRRAVKLLQQLEFDAARIQVLVNRMDRRSELTASDLTKLFDCRVDRSLPGDREGILRAFQDGSAVAASAPLGRAVAGLADKLCGGAKAKQEAQPPVAPASAIRG